MTARSRWRSRGVQGASVDAVSDRVRREAPCIADDAAAERDAIADRVYPFRVQALM
jgi:hypothetical protein